MKKYSLAFFILSILFISIFSCKKINESTELGDGLIPGVDNVNTFEISLSTITDNHEIIDSPVLRANDRVVAGHLVDPEFGVTHANFQFGIVPTTIKHNPFVHKDTIKVIDSVVLSLAYVGGYGDTSGAFQTLRVFEISPLATGFKVDSVFKYNDPNSEFPTTGPELGSKTFQVSKIKDPIILRQPDSTQVSNVVRIPLSLSLGTRFSNFDTTNSASGGFNNDSIFRTLFRGLAIKADNSGNVLSYFDLTNTANSKLTVYYQIVHANGTRDTLAYDFAHVVFRGINLAEAKTNYIQRNRGGSNWDAVLANAQTSDSLIYLQSPPNGSFASVVIPNLSGLSNRVVHLAEIIATIPAPYQSGIFTPPARLFMDRKRDTSLFLFERDIPVNIDGSIGLETFGGALKSNQYKFNITRYVQNIVTNGEASDTLRLYAPFRAILSVGEANNKLPEIQFADRIASGRVILAGGNYSDSIQRLRLRIIYSNL